LATHTIKFKTHGDGALRFPARDLVDIISALLDGASQALRLRVDGVSTKRGARPDWLDAATEVDVVGLHAGSAVLHLSACALHDAAPDIVHAVSQRDWFDLDAIPIKKNDTALDIFFNTMLSVRHDQDALVDKKFMETCCRFISFAEKHGEIEVSGGGLGGAKVFSVADHTAIRTKQQRTPDPQAVSFHGVLVACNVSTRTGSIIREDTGETIRFRVGPDECWTWMLKRMLNLRVRLEGTVYFGPSGKALLVEANSMEAAWRRHCEEEFEYLAEHQPYRLLAYLENDDLTPSELTFAAEYAGLIRNATTVVPALTRLLSHDSAPVREGAIYGLSYHVDASVRAALAQLAKEDTSDGVREAAQEVIDRCSP